MTATRRTIVLGITTAAMAVVAAGAIATFALPAEGEEGRRGASSAPKVAAAATWIGSPLTTSTWPNEVGCDGAVYPSSACSLPYAHHILWTNPSNGELNDWAADLQSVTVGDPVVLYAEGVDETIPVDAVVQSVGFACGSQDPAQGGHVVAVELSSAGEKIGTMTYAHIEPSVEAGDSINRWGTQLGTVGSYVPNGCWSGAHVHVEMSSQTNFACYNATYAPGAAMAATNFIGFVGGDYAASPRQPCP